MLVVSDTSPVLNLAIIGRLDLLQQQFGKGADWLLLDERDARRVAKSLGLKVTGVLGILFRARLAGQLSSLREAMDQLRDLADFRIGAALYAELLQAAREA